MPARVPDLIYEDAGAAAPLVYFDIVGAYGTMSSARTDKNQKYSAFVLAQISRITPLVSLQMRGVGHRHERAVRCDGR